MTRYSVQPRDRIFLKGCGFLSFAKNMSKNISKNVSKNLSGKNFLITLNNLQQMHFQKESFKKQQKQLVMKLLTELRKFHKIHNKIIQRQLQMKMIKKYLKKDIYLQKKDKRLLIILD